ncbi:MAG: EamA family transporter [Lachnospiraceae bacterium]|nr:EamA family transporter [Lachnospiraceae bacterium]
MMRDNFYLFALLALSAVFIADISQIILKKAAVKKYDSFIKSYLNFPVICAYGLFLGSTILNVIALRRLPLSLTPIWLSCGQIFIAVLSYFLLHEPINKKKLLGLGIIVVGVVVFSLQL